VSGCEDLVLIITDDERLTLNMRTWERFPAPEVAAPASRPIFECGVDVLVAASFSSFGYGSDPMRQLRAICEEEFGGGVPN